MIMTRSHAIATAVAAAAALTATGITYASAVPAPQAQVAPASVLAQAPMGGEGGNTGKGNEGRGNEGNERRGNEREGRRHYEGRIHINEREFSGRPDGCITVVSGLGAKSFNIRNDSRNEVEVFRGAVCDNGAPIATVGPRSSANNVRPGKDEDEDFEKGEHHEKKHHEKMNDGVKVKNGVVASFRVVKRHHGEGGEFGEGGDFGDY
ncbi:MULTISPECIES: hypothetical protein [unclassified Streptomyces]|uniref:hypothetical protein n=1 Tax=unclassified Streptomyces TaxID=2593676 RepID=UPI00225553D0|nr:MULTISPECIES: hypothetical protein [unclassified Streptomyces]WSU19734.1 hypothetical protein OG508_00775 [Streptomyces sp. NBC_01108]MCX4792372.1 hypothetical protein [Streptomyces sp. NBC_01221]MCX4799752.1 hypothetical protein [Streptomyces sp. NBC_01242]WSP60663.1 hypothetical protein OG466_00880 [Streptomyces sp. NBC_01240]WSP67706.1 hypothetical protein OG466_39560 [Streptomyces sp. NBC_01240]